MAKSPTQLLYSLNRDLARGIAADTSKEVAKVLDQYIKSRGSPKAVVAPALAELNRETAIAAQKAMIQGYKDRPITQSRLVDSYRIGAPPSGKAKLRYAGGQLLRSLGDEKNARSTSVSWGLLDVQFMDRNAPQWYRMSFGAGVSSPSNVVKPMTNPLNKRKITRSGILAEYGPSAAFSLPGKNKGRWFVLDRFGSGGYGEIHISRLKGSPPLAGLMIEPSRFVQKGIEEGNRIYPRGLVNIAIQFLDPKRRGAIGKQLTRNK